MWYWTTDLLITQPICHFNEKVFNVLPQPTLKYESEAISLGVNGSCFSSKTLQMVGYESGKKRGLQSSFYLSLSLSVRTKESNLFPYFKLELSCHPLLDPIKVIQIFLR